MQVTFEFAATTRDAVGERRIERTVPAGTTVERAVHTVCDEFAALAPIVIDTSDRIRPGVNVLVDGEPAGEGLDATLRDGATITLLPAVSGGARMAADPFVTGTAGAVAGGVA